MRVLVTGDRVRIVCLPYRRPSVDVGRWGYIRTLNYENLGCVGVSIDGYGCTVSFNYLELEPQSWLRRVLATRWRIVRHSAR